MVRRRDARDADAVMLTRGGKEVSVAATKTFTAQVAALAALALRLAAVRGALEECRAWLGQAAAKSQ